MNEEFFIVNGFPDILVNKEGKFIYKNRNSVYMNNDEKPKIVIKIGNKLIYRSAALLVLKTFKPIKDINKLVVFYKDGNSKNIKLENLEWITNSQNQIISFKKRGKVKRNILFYSLPDYELEIGIFPIPIENEIYKDYYHIPVTDLPYIINKNGDIIDLKTGKNKKYSISHKNYLTTNLRINNSKASKYFFNKLISYGEHSRCIYKHIPVHRLVALLFCEIPERHKGKVLTELQVNHIDGNKNNNHYTNLEWCDNNENMQHARKNGLFKLSRNVLAKNIKTNNIISFYSIQKCFEYFKNNFNCSFNVVQLRTHLVGKNYGMIVKNDHVFKFDDGSHWPDKLVKNPDHITLSTICNVYGKNIITNDICIFSSLEHAADYLKLNINRIRLARYRKGPEFPIDNWIFGSLNGLPISKKLKGNKK